MKSKKLQKTLAIILALGMLISTLPISASAQGTIPTGPSRSIVSKTPTHGLETYTFEPVDKFGLTEAELAWVHEVQRVDRFIIQLEEPSLVTYQGEIMNYPAPERDESGKIDVFSEPSQIYLERVNQQLDSAILTSAKAIGRDLEVYARYDVVLNGFAAKMTADEAAQLRQMDGVKEVYPDLIYYPDTDVSPTWLGVDGIWDGTNVPDDETAKGEGVIVGILDTGINMDHPSFAAVGPVDEYVHVNPYGTGVYKGLCASDSDNYKCNDKLIGVYAYTTETIRGEDADDHGSHTASTAAGNKVAFNYEGTDVTISGMAPHANIIAYDVCDKDGCLNSSSVSAIEQAIEDGVDVLNYSIGPSSGPGQSPYVSATELAFLEAVDAGIITATSAGNSGPNTSTGYKAAPWTLLVGNTNHGRIWGNPITVSSPDADPYSTVGLPHGGVGLAADLTNVPFKWGGGEDPAYDTACIPFPADYFKDSVALLTRGTCTFDEKIMAAQDAGAIAVVMRNNAPGAPIVMGLNDPTNVTIPAIMISKADGDAIVAQYKAGSTITYLKNFDSKNEAEWSDVLNQSTSRGPFTLADVMTPELVAPGTNVLAAYDSVGPDTEYGLMSGTSMAGPHAAGALALLTQLHDEWSPAARKSALVLTALAGTTKDYDLGSVDAFDYGNGRLDMHKAALTGLIMDETYEGFLDADPNEDGDVRDLNIPSYQNSTCVGECSFTRTFTSVADVAVSYTLDLTSDDDLVVEVSPTSFTIEPGETQEITVEINVDDAEPEVWFFGRIAYNTTNEWSTGEDISNVAFPFAVRPYTSTMLEEVVAETLRDAGATVVPDVLSGAISEPWIIKSGLVLGEETEITLSPDPTNGDPFDNLDQVWWKTFTLGEDADRLVFEITDTTAGDLDLFLGIGTVPDESMLVAQSATATALEYISLWGIPAGLPLWVLVQNWDGAADDSITLTEAIIYPEDAENWDVSIPEEVEALEPYDVTISWDIDDMPTPSVYYGMFWIVDAANSKLISTTQFDLYRAGDDVVKTVDKEEAAKGDIVSYEIEIAPNYGNQDLEYEIIDALPEGVEYVPDSLQVSGSNTDATYDPATRTISWNGIAPRIAANYVITTNENDPYCAMPMGDGGYINLMDYGVFPNPGIYGDGDAWQYEGVGLNMSWFDGRTSEPPIFIDDGHAYMNGSFNGDNYWMWDTQEFPNPLAPNDVMAAFMTDIDFVYDSALNKGVSAAGLTGGVAWVVEYDDVFPYGDPDTTMDFEFFLWANLDPALSGADILFAYDNVVGDWSGYNTIGLENGDGTVGATYQHDGPTPADGLVVCFDYATVGGEAIVISFEAEVTTSARNLEITNLVNHDSDALNAKFEESKPAVFKTNNINIDPVAEDQDVITEEDTAKEITLLASDGNDGDPLSYMIVDEPEHGSLSDVDGNKVTYTPDEDYHGPDSFTFKVNDGFADSNVATVTITVTSVNDWVTANDDAYETLANVSLVVVEADGVLKNDVLIDKDEEVSVQILDEPQHGTLSMNDDGSFTYVPDTGFMGIDSFRYLVLSVQNQIHGGPWSDFATVTILVKPQGVIYLPLILK